MNIPKQQFLSYRSEIAEQHGAELLPAWRETLAGALIVIGLCWQYILPSFLPVRWWMLLPLVIVGSALRWRATLRPRAPYLALLAFVAILFVFAGLGVTALPMTDYGTDKFLRFTAFGGLAYLCAFRQTPLTANWLRGVRWALAITLVLCLVLAYVKRSLFLQTSLYGLDEIRYAFSSTGLPLVIAIAAACVIPRTLSPVKLLIAGVLLLAAAGLCVFVRGRYDAILLAVCAVILLLGPPWQHLWGRVLVSGILAAIGVMIYQYVLPQFGESFVYLTWADPGTLGGRTFLFQEAWNGFIANPLGQGLGSFQLQESVISYPHNIILESAYEMGIFGFAAILSIYLFVARRVWVLWLSPPHRIPAAILAIVFIQMLKAGDITTIGFLWVYTYLLLVATPIDQSWPLLQGRAA